ncbi:S-layer homology domain-containing protein [Anoxybacterium hadale]|uniref:S-layer homology domain-containing protein n=1 Tax=Anoxybacterium hadale TaxID=3408580 RepID=A0ACD1AFU1_9FIRM|nr:S-layer homology domain-containing protein [Clostridiales bacterium]
MIKSSEHRKRKRLQTGLSMILVAMLLFTAAAVPSSADSGADSATTLLASMGIISADGSGNYNLSNTVSRAEFAKMLVMASSYKDLVDTSSKSSPYKDVPAGNWAAPYIKIAVSNGMMSGYSDGTFRPDAAVTLEQGVNSALKLLGYTASDFTGSFPAAQMNVYYSNGLSKNIAGGIGTLLSKGNAANLIYNMLSAKLKDGSKTYAESLGYSLNDSGAVDYASIISDNMYGPYTVNSSNWAGELGMNASALTIYKNGSLVNASDVHTYDILYYSQSKGTVWVYDDKVTGVYEDASPSQNAITSVTISGTSYPLESSAAFAALSSTGSLKIGSAVTLLLGKTGGVADAVSATKINASAVVYITEVGTKNYTNSSGKEYTSNYFRGVKPDGTEIEYTTSSSTLNVGSILTVRFDSNGTMILGGVTGGSITGEADADLRMIGTASISTNATILDTSMGNYVRTSMERLDGINFASGDVLYYEASGGKITALILKDVTGDTSSYGVVTKSSSSDSSMSLSGSYQYLIDGVSQTLKTSGSTLGAKAGPARFYGESGEISMIRNLTATSSRMNDFTLTELKVDDDTETYPVSANVAVYSKSSGNYTLSSISAAMDAYQSGKSLSFYYDKAPNRGGCIRVIVIN